MPRIRPRRATAAHRIADFYAAANLAVISATVHGTENSRRAASELLKRATALRTIYLASAREAAARRARCRANIPMKHTLEHCVRQVAAQGKMLRLP